ncbi:PilW family protein [Kaarinaea lacus]
MNNRTNKQHGITLIEILVSLALSLIILAGIMHIFLNNKQTYRVQEAFARLQESGRFAMQFIVKDLRMAGYVGCGGKISTPVNIANYYPPPNGDTQADEVSMFTGSGIEGFEYSALPILLSDSVSLTTAKVLAGSDIVRIKRAAATGARLTGNMTSDNANIQLDGTTALGLFNVNDYMFISDCENADIFVANNVSASAGKITIAHSNSVNLDNKLSKAYQEDAEVYKFVNNTYYVGNNIAGEPALFRRTLLNAGALSEEELVDGIEDLQLLYGEDTDTDGAPNVYVDSGSVTNWSNIVAVRVELQVRSIEDNLSKSMTAYGDKRLRRTFTTSIAIRNRAI